MRFSLGSMHEGRVAFADHAKQAKPLAPGKSPLRSRIFFGSDHPERPAKGPSGYSRLRCCRGFVSSCESGREMTARVDTELAVRAAQVLLDRLRCDEERLRDLLVAQPLGRHVCDAPLARGQLVDTAQELAAWPRTGRRQLFVAPRRQRVRAALMGVL